MINLAGGASTNSRATRPLPPGAVKGETLSVKGAYETVSFTFKDGNERPKVLLSWVGGQSGLLWGGGPYPEEISRALKYSWDLVHGSYGHFYEYKLAEALGRVFDGYLTSRNMAVRFFSNGGDACAAAVRVARGLHGIPPIATQGYHGAQTDFAHQPAWIGYPYENVYLHRRFEFGDVPGLWSAASQASCVMIEVPAWDDEAAISEFLAECRKVCDEYTIPLIFDDVVCGFRLALAGTAARYGVKPDMVCLGKAMSATGGISALIGNDDLVGKLGNGDVFYSTTFGGAPDRCAVANATIRWLLEHQIEVYGGWRKHGERQPDGTWMHSSEESEGHLHKIGKMLKDGLIERGIPVVGQYERSALNFKTNEEWLAFCSHVIEQGVMLHRPQFPTLAHTPEDVHKTLMAVEMSMDKVPL